MRRLVVPAVAFVLLSLLGVFVVPRLVGLEGLRFDPRVFGREMLLSLVGLMILYFLFDGLRLQFTLRALGERVPFREIVRLVFINLFFSNITPLATGGGVAQVWYLARHGVPVGKGVAATTIRTALAMVAIFITVPVFLLTLPQLKGIPVLEEITGIVAVLTLAYVAGFLVLIFRVRWVALPLSWGVALLRRLGVIGEVRSRSLRRRLFRELTHFAVGFRGYLRGPIHHVLLSIVSTSVFLLVLFSFPWVIAANLGYEINYVESVGTLSVITFAMYFAPTPGGAGVSEAVFAGLFEGIVGPEHLILLILVWRITTIYLGVLIGFVVTQVELHRRVKR